MGSSKTANRAAELLNHRQRIASASLVAHSGEHRETPFAGNDPQAILRFRLPFELDAVLAI